MFGGGALSSTGAAVVGSLIVRTVRALEKLFSVACARRVNEILYRALRIFRTAPCDFVIALEFFPSSPIKRGAWEFCVPLPPPTRYNSHLKRPSKFTLLLSTTQIIGKFTIVWPCANWLIQLRSGAVIGSRVIYCQLDPRSLFPRRAKTTLLPLNTPPDWRTSRAAGNEIKWKNSLRCYRHWLSASCFAVADFLFSREMQNTFACAVLPTKPCFDPKRKKRTPSWVSVS